MRTWRKRSANASRPRSSSSCSHLSAYSAACLSSMSPMTLDLKMSAGEVEPARVHDAEDAVGAVEVGGAHDDEEVRCRSWPRVSAACRRAMTRAGHGGARVVADRPLGVGLQVSVVECDEVLGQRRRLWTRSWKNFASRFRSVQPRLGLVPARISPGSRTTSASSAASFGSPVRSRSTANRMRQGRQPLLTVDHLGAGVRSVLDQHDRPQEVGLVGVARSAPSRSSSSWSACSLPQAYGRW